MDEALRLRTRTGASGDDVSALGALAALHGQRGDTAAARSLFARARAAYRDVSPFVVAWLELEEAEMWRRSGRHDLARPLHEAAVARLPRYVAARAALAEVEAAAGRQARAVSLLEGLVPHTDDPEVWAQLAVLLSETGRAGESGALLERARARFLQLERRHRDAFADHAARFWLGPGRDQRRALGLARLNLRNRRSPSAHRLLLEVSLASGAIEEACRLAGRALALDRWEPALARLRARTRSACSGLTPASAATAGGARAPAAATAAGAFPASR